MCHRIVMGLTYRDFKLVFRGAFAYMHQRNEMIRWRICTYALQYVVGPMLLRFKMDFMWRILLDAPQKVHFRS
jgi:hypothetical protein